MTPKEKAEKLFNKYFSEIRMPSDCEGCMQCVDRCGNMVAIAKKYALIAVDEMINEYKQNSTFAQLEWVDYRIAFLKEVKMKLEKL
jgi:aldehyde:ferredoxin oxidoreductase